LRQTVTQCIATAQVSMELREVFVATVGLCDC